MDKRSKRQETDIREQIGDLGDQFNVIIIPGKQSDGPDDSWYPEYLDTIYSWLMGPTV